MVQRLLVKIPVKAYKTNIRPEEYCQLLLFGNRLLQIYYVKKSPNGAYRVS